MPINYEFEPEDVNKENLSIAEMSSKKLDWFRKVCAAVLKIPCPTHPEGPEAPNPGHVVPKSVFSIQYSVFFRDS